MHQRLHRKKHCCTAMIKLCDSRRKGVWSEFACAGSPRDGYECIVMDPPWENASAQRSNAYPTLPSRNLLGIPVKRLLHQVPVTAHRM